MFRPQRKLLSDLFFEAARDIVRRQYAEAMALIRGANNERLDLPLDAARGKKDKIKLAYLLDV